MLTVHSYQGDLTIVIDSEFSVRVPNDLFITPLASMDTSGNLNYNSTFSSILMDPLSGDSTTDLAVLGRYFFQQAYLNVNYDAGIFSLFNVNNSATSKNLISQGPACAPTDPSDGTTTSDLASATSIVPSSSARPAYNSLSGGAIAGIVIGSSFCAAVIAAFTVIAITFSRRRHFQKNDSAVSLNPRDAGNVYHYDSDPHKNESFSKEIPLGLHEADETGLHEADAMPKPGKFSADPYPRELPVDCTRHELPAS